MSDDCKCVNSYYKNKPKLKMEGQTTHNANYKAYKIDPQPQLQPPKVIQKHYDPDVLQTSYKATYVKPTIQNNSSSSDQNFISQYYQNKPKNVPFYSETSYNKSYEKPNVKFQPQPQYVYKPKDTKFEGSSSYKSEFVPKVNNQLKNTAQDSSIIKEYIAKKPKLPFEGSSSYKDTFKGHEVKPERQPQYRYQPKNTKFQGQSSYKSTFKQLPKEAYKSDLSYCPVHPDKVALK